MMMRTFFGLNSKKCLVVSFFKRWAPFLLEVAGVLPQIVRDLFRF